MVQSCPKAPPESTGVLRVNHSTHETLGDISRANHNTKNKNSTKLLFFFFFLLLGRGGTGV
jgi:hypothetical protein